MRFVFYMQPIGKSLHCDLQTSLQDQGYGNSVPWQHDPILSFFFRFCNHENSGHCRHEMALDADGRRLLVTSGSVRAPIYQVNLHFRSLSYVHTHADLLVA